MRVSIAYHRKGKGRLLVRCIACHERISIVSILAFSRPLAERSDRMVRDLRTRPSN